MEGPATDLSDSIKAEGEPALRNDGCNLPTGRQALGFNGGALRLFANRQAQRSLSCCAQSVMGSSQDLVNVEGQSPLLT